MQSKVLRCRKEIETRDVVSYIGFNEGLSISLTINKPQKKADNPDGYKEKYPDEVVVQIVDPVQAIGR